MVGTELEASTCNCGRSLDVGCWMLDVGGCEQEQHAGENIEGSRNYQGRPTSAVIALFVLYSFAGHFPYICHASAMHFSPPMLPLDT